MVETCSQNYSLDLLDSYFVSVKSLKAVGINEMVTLVS